MEREPNAEAFARAAIASPRLHEKLNTRSSISGEMPALLSRMLTAELLASRRSCTWHGCRVLCSIRLPRSVFRCSFSSMTDVIDDSLPMHRFTLAAVGSNCALIAIEHGGFVHGFDVAEYGLTTVGWRLRWLRTVVREPNSVADLVEAAP